MDSVIEFLKDTLVTQVGVSGALFFILVAICIYAWYQHQSKKLLQERIDSEKEKRAEMASQIMAAQKSAPVSSSHASAPINGPKVLVIDDEPMLRNMLALYLSRTRKGAIISQSGDGVEGLAAILRDAPDFIVMDVVMPGMNGGEVLEAMAARGINIPTVMISGYVNGLKEIAQSTKAKPSNISFLSKPFNLSDLDSAIDRGIRLSEK
jgi:CheY-like chemotaxis protein